MEVRIRDGQVQDVKLRIYEPPRFFEAFLRGRRFTEVPDITARICGICPVAYQMSSIGAMEDVCGVEVPDQVRALRRMLYCGEWVESHALHVFMLHAPDFLGYANGFEMARDHREVVEGALQLKKAGNELMRVIGGREIHPINVRVGGFYRAPTRAELAPVVEQLKRAREFAIEAVSFTASLPFPDFEEDFVFVALREADVYAIEGGTAGVEHRASTSRRRSTTSTSSRSTWSTPPRCTRALLDGTRYLVGPLARYALNRDRLSPAAREAARRRRPRAGVPQPVPQHRRARGGDRLRARRGAAPDRRLRAAGPAGGRGRAARGRRVRLDRGAARPALAPLRARRRRHHPRARGSCRRPRRTRAGSSRACRLRPASRRPGRRRAAPALRAGGPQLRPVHLLRDALPAPGDRPRLDRHRASATRWRGDDGAGLAVARRLREIAPAGVEVREVEGDATALVDAVVGCRTRRRRRCRAVGRGARAPCGASTRAHSPCPCSACAPRRMPSASPTPSSWRDRWTACRAGWRSTRSRERASSPATA